MKKSRVLILLLVAAVFDSVQGVSWSWLTGDDDSTDIVDLDAEPEDSESTLDELKEDVIFYLFTNDNPEDSQTLYIDDDDTLDSSNFDALKPTRILIHGWRSSSLRPVCADIRDAYLSQGDYNIICVEWKSYANQVYVYARTKIVTVGQYVGLMIDFLEIKGMDLGDLTIVGHSLGAHVGGVAARSATNNVSSLIALDPAGPLFTHFGATSRLRSTDADFTQVIHTNTALLGHSSELGDVDIWPNGGEWQPGCTLDVTGMCSHRRSYKFLIESIQDTDDAQFTAIACTSYDEYSEGDCADNETTYLGGSNIDTTASGNYYLDTNSDSPYSQG